MHPNLNHLIELQQVDSRLGVVQSKLAAFPKQIAEVNARVEAVRAQLAHAKGELLKSLKERKTYEMDVEQWKEKARKYKDQSFQVKSNEAYRALQHEIQMAEDEAAKAEDRLLERMVSGEEFDRQVKSAALALAEAEKTAEAERKKIDAEKAVVEKELVELKTERAQVVTAIPEDLLDHYTRLAKRHGGIALAEVREDETCSMCRVRVRPHTFQVMRDPKSDELIHCETCTRILYTNVPESTLASRAAANGSAEPEPATHTGDA
jgi:predicted  nucleic acid-binding Zn-ribbon protein